MTIQERFQNFHNEHPEVYSSLVDLARDAKSKGYSHYGIRTLWEVLRYSFEIARDPREDFKLNDHYHSRYARLIDSSEPDLKGFFELRTLKSA